MGNIVLLDELTINKIAAGEVIERPASVVKEMVENSIDAGANNITVEIKNGGISYIRVTDNGKGIAQDDLEIAFERHATSKIRSADDLNVVTSMGFRGEALASIAAIAKVEMVSKTESQETGYKVVVEAGDVLEKEEVGCQTGTSITVSNLFFNTPVRYKFLKKDYTETGYVEDVITRIALVNPNIAIKLINTGKTVIQTNGNGDIKSVIYSIYGKDIANGILPVEYTYEDVKVSGVIGKPEIARSNRSNQLFFVNKRYIKDKTVSSATEQAYKGLIPIGRFGFVVLNIEMNPAKVDVNVHPAKLEVRFEEESKIFQSIYHSIKDTLLKSELVANTDRKELELNQEKEYKTEGLYDFRKNETEKIEQYTDDESKIKTNNIVQEVYNQKEKTTETEPSTSSFNVGQGGPVNTADILEKLKKIKEDLEKENEESRDKEQNLESKDENIEKEVIQEEQQETNNEQEDIQNNSEQNQIVEENENKLEKINEQIKELENIQYEEPEKVDFNEMYKKLFGVEPKLANEIMAQEAQNTQEISEESNEQEIDNLSVFEEVEEYQRPNYKFIGIIFKTYIILEIDKEMYMIDQHAAHERILYEKVKANYYSDQAKDSQILLLPDVITLTHKEKEIVIDSIDMFEKAGFILEEFGENTIKLTGVPTICVDLDTKELFLETLDELSTISRTAKQEKEERFIATVACKSAVKAGMVLTQEEVDNLVQELLKLPNPFTCPHGRPTARKMTKYDIERKFSRK